VATGATMAATEASMREALAFHLDGLREGGVALPEPGARATYVDVAA
jgi:predicted RNase H-like HicB family nuclease